MTWRIEVFKTKVFSQLEEDITNVVTANAQRFHFVSGASEGYNTFAGFWITVSIQIADNLLY